jgi:hypothetical protein
MLLSSSSSRAVAQPRTLGIVFALPHVRQTPIAHNSSIFIGGVSAGLHQIHVPLERSRATRRNCLAEGKVEIQDERAGNACTLFSKTGKENAKRGPWRVMYLGKGRSVPSCIIAL